MTVILVTKRPPTFKGYKIPNKFQDLTYENADFRYNDDCFQFFGKEGSTIKDDIYNFAAFYENVNGEQVRFIDDNIVHDYEDLVTNYIVHRDER